MKCANEGQGICGDVERPKLSTDSPMHSPPWCRDVVRRAPPMRAGFSRKRIFQHDKRAGKGPCPPARCRPARDLSDQL